MEYQSPVQLSHCQLNFRTPIMIGFVPQNNKEFIFCLNISVRKHFAVLDKFTWQLIIYMMLFLLAGINLFFLSSAH